MHNLHYKRYVGKEIAQILSPLADLRIAVFYDFPYLYEGTHAYELEYLDVYVQSDRGFVFAVFDGEQLVGAASCIPLVDEMEAVRAPFTERKIDHEGIFYFGESILLPAYRGQGIGHRFFDERERHAQSYGTYTACYFCSVVRPEDHPLLPQQYRTNDVFWKKRGYQKQDDMSCQMSWLDRGEQEETLKDLVFWKRDL